MVQAYTRFFSCPPNARESIRLCSLVVARLPPGPSSMIFSRLDCFPALGIKSLYVRRYGVGGTRFVSNRKTSITYGAQNSLS